MRNKYFQLFGFIKVTNETVKEKMAEKYVSVVDLYNPEEDINVYDALPSSKKEADQSTSIIYTNTDISEQYMTFKSLNKPAPKLPWKRTENTDFDNLRKANTVPNLVKLPVTRDRSPDSTSDDFYSTLPRKPNLTLPTNVPTPCHKRLTTRDIRTDDIFSILEYAIQKPYKGMSQLTKRLTRYTEPHCNNSPWDLMKDRKNLVTTATCSGRMEIMQVLVSYGADLAAYDGYHKNSLHYASQYGYADIIRLIINSNVNINVPDCDNNTPLHIACLFKKPATVLQLIELNANLGAQNEKSETPYDIAVNMNMKDIKIVLERENERILGKDMQLDAMKQMHLSELQKAKSTHNEQLKEMKEVIDNTIDAKASKIEEQCKVDYENTIKIVDTQTARTKRELELCVEKENKRHSKEVEDLRMEVDDRIQVLHRGHHSLSRDVAESHKLIQKVKTDVDQQFQDLSKQYDVLQKEIQQSHKESQQSIIGAVKSEVQQAVVLMNQTVLSGFQSMANKPTNLAESPYVEMEPRYFHPQSMFQPQSYHPYRNTLRPQPGVVPGSHGYPRHHYDSVPHASRQSNASAYTQYKYPENTYESINLQSAPQFIPGHPQLIPSSNKGYLTDEQKSVLQHNYKPFTEQAKLKHLLKDLYSEEIINTENKNKLKSCDNVEDLAEEIHDVLMRGNQLQCKKMRKILIKNNQEAVAKLLPVVNL